MSITMERQGAVAPLTIDNPGDHNALDDEQTTQMLNHLDALHCDHSVRAVVLKGKGRTFTPGGNMGMLAGMPQQALDEDTRVALEQRMRGTERVVEALGATNCPTIATIDGSCVGAGLAWAAACDLRLAAEESTFDTAFLKLGLGTDFGTTWLLANVLGRAVATDWHLRPRRIAAAEAEYRGFVSRVTPGTHLLEAAVDLARSLAEVPVAVTAVRDGLSDARNVDLHTYLDPEAMRFVETLASSEAEQRVAAAVAAAKGHHARDKAHS